VGGLRGREELGGEIATADILVQRAGAIDQNVGGDRLGDRQFRHEGLKSAGEASFRVH
jgi:hypothetical protein